jgi:hypothetical protein
MQQLLNLLDTSFGREYLVKNLLQAKFKDDHYQTLSDGSFLDMYNLIFNALLNYDKKLEKNEKFFDYEFAVLLTKSIFYYCK